MPPLGLIHNADISRLINSSEVQAVVRPPRGEAKTKRFRVQKKNPLVNKQVMLRLNPYAKAFIEQKLGSWEAPKEKPEAPSETFEKTLADD